MPWTSKRQQPASTMGLAFFTGSSVGERIWHKVDVNITLRVMRSSHVVIRLRVMKSTRTEAGCPPNSILLLFRYV